MGKSDGLFWQAAQACITGILDSLPVDEIRRHNSVTGTGQQTCSGRLEAGTGTSVVEPHSGPRKVWWTVRSMGRVSSMGGGWRNGEGKDPVQVEWKVSRRAGSGRLLPLVTAAGMRF